MISEGSTPKGREFGEHPMMYSGHRSKEDKKPNIEIRNSKQYQMNKIQMTETVLCDIYFEYATGCVCF